MKAEIIRSPEHYAEHGVFGAFLLTRDDASPVLGLFTLEEEWRDNMPRESCIPLGAYVCVRRPYYKKQRAQDPWWAQFDYETFEITGVPGRSAILFHPGNTEEDTEGCVLLGSDLGWKEVEDEEGGGRMTKRALTGSRKAFTMFMRALAGVDSFPLTVRDA